MSAAPFNIRLVQERIRAGVPALRSIQGAADYAAITGLRDFPAPCAYVVLSAETGTETRSGISLPGQQSALAQKLEVTFGVVVVTRNYRERRGDQLLDEERELLGQIRAQLLGWTPEVNGGRACQLLRGDLLDYDASIALWADLYSTQIIIKAGKNP